MGSNARVHKKATYERCNTQQTFGRTFRNARMGSSCNSLRIGQLQPGHERVPLSGPEWKKRMSSLVILSRYVHLKPPSAELNKRGGQAEQKREQTNANGTRPYSVLCFLISPVHLFDSRWHRGTEGSPGGSTTQEGQEQYCTC